VTCRSLKLDDLITGSSRGGRTNENEKAHLWRLLSLQGTDIGQSAELRDLARVMNKNDIAEAESRASGWLQSHKRNEPRAIEPTFVMLH